MNTICVMLNSDYNVTLLTEMLEPTYRIIVGKEKIFSQHACDLLITDYETLNKSLAQVMLRKKAGSPDYLPVLLLIPEGKLNALSEDVWDTIDDVLEIPLHKKRLHLTLCTLLRVKNYSLQLHEADRARNKLSSIIAHDLKNLFSALVTLSKLLIEQYDSYSDADRKRVTHRIHNGVMNTLKLLENMLQWSKIQTGKLDGCIERVNLRMLARHSTSVFQENAKEKNINIHLEIDENIMVYADINMLTTIIRNLVSNAIKFTPHNGEIRILSQENEHFIEVVVADTGIGIRNEDIFKLFRVDMRHSTTGTAGEYGTGLGLIICKEFVEKNGGKLWVESQWKKGSHFKFSLPKATVSPKTKSVYLHKEMEEKTLSL